MATANASYEMCGLRYDMAEVMTAADLYPKPDELDTIFARLANTPLKDGSLGYIIPATELVGVYAAIRAYIAREVLEGRIDEAGSVQLTYGHSMAQTHAGCKWQSMIERRDDLKAQLTKEDKSDA